MKHELFYRNITYLIGDKIEDKKYSIALAGKEGSNSVRFMIGKPVKTKDKFKQTIPRYVVIEDHWNVYGHSQPCELMGGDFVVIFCSGVPEGNYESAFVMIYHARHILRIADSIKNYLVDDQLPEHANRILQ